MWQWRETSVRPPALDTLDLPEHLTRDELQRPFREANVLFTKLYADDIEQLPWGETAVDAPTIYDLLEAEPSILAAHKEYAISGVFAAFTSDIDVSETHIAAALEEK
jgi:hypothetical protein